MNVGKISVYSNKSIIVEIVVNIRKQVVYNCFFLKNYIKVMLFVPIALIRGIRLKSLVMTSKYIYIYMCVEGVSLFRSKTTN
jgi:hypothetical protein